MSNPFNSDSNSLRERANARHWEAYIDKSLPYDYRQISREILERQGVFPPLRTRIRLWCGRVCVPTREGGES